MALHPAVGSPVSAAVGRPLSAVAGRSSSQMILAESAGDLGGLTKEHGGAWRSMVF